VTGRDQALDEEYIVKPGRHPLQISPKWSWLDTQSLSQAGVAVRWLQLPVYRFNLCMGLFPWQSPSRCTVSISARKSGVMWYDHLLPEFAEYKNRTEMEKFQIYFSRLKSTNHRIWSL
jgi:hypothetical protein